MAAAVFWNARKAKAYGPLQNKVVNCLTQISYYSFYNIWLRIVNSNFTILWSRLVCISKNMIWWIRISFLVVICRKWWHTWTQCYSTWIIYLTAKNNFKYGLLMLALNRNVQKLHYYKSTAIKITPRIKGSLGTVWKKNWSKHFRN